MSRNGDTARLVKIMTYIAGIETIIKRHGGAKPALEDTEGQYALIALPAPNRRTGQPDQG